MRVTVDITDHVAVVALNRPVRHNGLDGALFHALNDAQDRVASMRRYGRSSCTAWGRASAPASM